MRDRKMISIKVPRRKNLVIEFQTQQFSASDNTVIASVRHVDDHHLVVFTCVEGVGRCRVTLGKDESGVWIGSTLFYMSEEDARRVAAFFDMRIVEDLT